MKEIALTVIALFVVNGCATIRDEDLAAWVGQPVKALDSHPFFQSLPVIRTIRPDDGFEVRNYVYPLGNNAEKRSHIMQCMGGISNRMVDFPTYMNFNKCVSPVKACSSIFSINEGKVRRFNIVQFGSVTCSTKDGIQPRSNSAADIR